MSAPDPTRPAATESTDARGAGDGPSGPPQAGPGRLFTLLYGIFAVGASSRAAVEVLTKFDRAPVSYALSAVAAVIYVAGFVLLLRWGHPGSRRALRVLCMVELTGVLTVGTLSVLRPDLFPKPSVWSMYGMGYLFIPAVLPVFVLRWLHRTGGVQAPRRA